MAEETLTVTIEKLVQGGRGLAHHGSEVVFVRGAIPAETVSVSGGSHRRGVQEATVTGVLVASPDRVPPPCPVYEVCGGCQFQHIRYEAQLVQKEEILKETLLRVGKVAVETLAPVIASPNSYGYRSSVRFVVFREKGTFTVGFYREGTNEPVAAAGCLLVPEPIRELVAGVSARLADQPRLPVHVEALEIRRSLAFGSTLLVHRTGPASLKGAEALFNLYEDLPSVVGQVVVARHRGRWVRGQDWIADRLEDLIFRISDRSFMPANWPVNETLSHTVSDWACASSRTDGQGLRVLELYAGIGTLGLPLARRGALVTEVEANSHALADARHAAKANHIGRCRFRPLRAEAMLEATQAGEYDVVLMDTPRTGLSREGLNELLRLQVERLLYLSCDPATLARDLGRLCGGGYRITRIQPFDMCPQTAHLETLVELAR